MTLNSNPGDETEFVAIGLRLAEAMNIAIERWLSHQLAVRLEASGRANDDTYQRAEQLAAETAVAVAAQIQQLAATPIDLQATTPLSIVRSALQPATALLSDSQVPPAVRDSDDVARFPDDTFGLTPASFADIDLELASVAVEWGAAKAWLHKQRHGAQP